MGRHGYAAGALVGVLITGLALLFITVRTGEPPRIVNPWPLLAALGACVATWWLQGLIVAVLARPRLERLRLLDTFRVYMAGTFVAGISPVRGAEIPLEVYLLRRLGLSAGEGSAVVGIRVLLDAAILTPAALCGLALTSTLPAANTPGLLLAGLAILVALAILIFALGRRSSSVGSGRDWPGWARGGRARISGFLGDARRSVASYRGHRKSLAYAAALTIVYWAFRLCCGPLALMAVGWSGGWTPVIVAQLLLASFVLPLAPTPGGSGARELGLAALLSAHVPEGQLLSGIVVYSGLTYYLPVVVGALFAGSQLWLQLFPLKGGRPHIGERGPRRRPTVVPVRSYNGD
jgi:glycosyltransferase 2 family protein